MLAKPLRYGSLLLLFVLSLTSTATLAWAETYSDQVSRNIDEISRQLSRPEFAPNIGFAFDLLQSPIGFFLTISAIVMVITLFAMLFKIVLDVLLIVFPPLQDKQGLRRFSSFNSQNAVVGSFGDYFKNYFLKNIVVGITIIAIFASGLAMTLTSKTIAFAAYATSKIASVNVVTIMKLSEAKAEEYLTGMKSKYQNNSADMLAFQQDLKSQLEGYCGNLSTTTDTECLAKMQVVNKVFGQDVTSDNFGKTTAGTNTGTNTTGQ